MSVSQIFLSDVQSDYPPYIKHCINTVQSNHDSESHTIYNKESLRQFIADNYEPEVVNAYDKLIPYTYKADLGKACLLYMLGGWYYDIAVQVISKLVVPETISCIAYTIEEEQQCLTPMAVIPSALYSEPYNPVLQYAIELTIDNCNKEYYGHTPFCPTGPNLYGRAFAKYYAKHGVDPRFIFGKLKLLTPMCPNKNGAFVLPDGTIHALIKPSGNTLADLGTTGTNTYTDLYFEKKIYVKE